MNQTMRITGKWASPLFEYIRVHIKRCDLSDPNCLPDHEINGVFNTFGAFYVNYFFINKIVNPIQADPIEFYLHDQIYDKVNYQVAIDTNVYLK